MKDDNQLKNRFDDSGDRNSRITEQEAALMAVFNEARALFYRGKVVAEQIHCQGLLSSGKRGVLMSVQMLGPQTVPQLARARPVSRQHIQSLVNVLLDEGHVEYLPNPAHKRSRLVRITETGMNLVEEMSRREAKVLEGIALDVDIGALRKAAKVLYSIREYFESDIWQQHLMSVTDE